jgi:hypothetical protein
VSRGPLLKVCADLPNRQAEKPLEFNESAGNCRRLALARLLQFLSHDRGERAAINRV